MPDINDGATFYCGQCEVFAKRIEIQEKRIVDLEALRDQHTITRRAAEARFWWMVRAADRLARPVGQIEDLKHYRRTRERFLGKDI